MKADKRIWRTWSMIGQTGVFGSAMLDLAEEYPDLCVVTADLCNFSGLERFRKQFPENLYNVGIAEQNMLGVSAGLAGEGFPCFAATYASFAMSRALEQVRVCMGYMRIPVKLVGLAAGYSAGILGATHMAIEDIAIMRSVPGLTILSPADCLEEVKCFEAVLHYDKPVYIRLTGSSRMPMVYTEDYEYRIGKSVVLREGEDIAILATGSMVHMALRVAKRLETEGIAAGVINIHTLQPFEEQILEPLSSRKCIVTLEEHSTDGGLGTIVGETMLQKPAAYPPLCRIGLPKRYPHAARYPYLLEQAGLTEKGIAEKIKKQLNAC